jgi:hypothetical protein
MNAILIGMNYLKEQSVSDDGKITVALAEDSCVKINETLKNLIQN